MSINDLQNINNIRQTHHYISVNPSTVDKQMSEEQSLFNFNSSNFAENNSNELFLFPGLNAYDDEDASLFKSGNSFYI